MFFGMLDKKRRKCHIDYCYYYNATHKPQPYLFIASFVHVADYKDMHLIVCLL